MLLMKAIIADIHGNLEALRAVLADIAGYKVSEIYCLGDIVGYGPNPRECVDLLANCTVTLLGNQGNRTSMRYGTIVAGCPCQSTRRVGGSSVFWHGGT